MREEIETPGEGQIRAMLTIAGNPVLSTPDGRRLGEALAGLDFMAAIDIYVNETTRHADVILPPTTALERDHYDIVFHGLAVRNTARWTPAPAAETRRGQARLGDLPRAGAALPAPAGPPTRPAHPSQAARATGAQPAADRRRPAPHQRRDHPQAAAPPPRGRRPRAAAPDHARAPADPGPPHRPRARPRGRRPAAAAGVARRATGGRRRGTRRARADRSPAQAGQQRLVPQHRAGQPRPPASPAADAPRRPRRARHRRRRPGHRDVTRRVR